MLALLLLSSLLTLGTPARSTPQDSTLVKKPSPRLDDNMPVRKGSGTSKPMPSPKYYRVIPTDTVRIDKTKRFEAR